MGNTQNQPAQAGQVERRVRRQPPVVGMWLRIKKRYDNGGFPLIRVDEIDKGGNIFVTDWLDFDKQHLSRTRRFASSDDEFSRRSRCWKKVKPNAPVRSVPENEL